MLQRPHILEMESLASAAEMLDLHSAHLRRVNERSAAIAFVVEQAAPADGEVRVLWEQMNHNRLVGVRWATQTLLAALLEVAHQRGDVGAAETRDWTAY